MSHHVGGGNTDSEEVGHTSWIVTQVLSLHSCLCHVESNLHAPRRVLQVVAKRVLPLLVLRSTLHVGLFVVEQFPRATLDALIGKCQVFVGVFITKFLVIEILHPLR